MIVLRIFLLFKPLLFFGAVGLVLIATGSIYSLLEAFSQREGIPVLGALVIILGVQSLFFGLLNDQISWSRDYEQARQQSAADGKHLLLDFTAAPM